MSQSFKSNSPTHLALQYARMMARKPFVTADEIRVCFPTKFEKHSRVLRSMELLERHGLVNAAEGGWRINVAGVNYLLKIAHTNVLVRGDKN